jgi:tetratricopeptide (TPR) repeat protein
VRAQILASVLATQLGDNKVAEEHIQLAMQKEKDHLQILLHLIGILSNSGRLGQAELVITKALETSPQSTSLIYDYAMLIHIMRREPEAKKLMIRLLDFDSDNHAALNYLAYSNTYQPTDREKLSLALIMIDTALQYAPLDGHYLDTKGWILYNLGHYNEAIKVTTLATKLLPDSGLIREHLGDSLLKANFNQQANEVYRSALELYERQEGVGMLLDHDAIRRVRGKLVTGMFCSDMT